MDIDFLISLALGLIMFGIGSSLRTEDFKNVFKNPKSLTIGLVLQIIALPLLALLIVSFTDLSPEWKMGIFIVSICPGGTTSNFISYILKTDVALSISLTVVNSFIILFTIPTLVFFGLEYFELEKSNENLSLVNTITQVFLVLIFPVLIGLFLNEKYPITIQKIQNYLKYFNILLLAFVFGVKFFASETNGGSGINQEIIYVLLPACLLLHSISMIGSYFLSRKLKLNNLQSTTIGIEVGLQNTGLALLVSTTIVKNEVMSQPALVFAIFSFFTTLIFGYVMKNRTALLKSFTKRKEQ
ncbi:bile acid:sodium symporter [Kordia sp.]|uniref:bile acid:sodium symporter family protein n=1 Tax=Kordia sp. TaxID=1965332 RepID=UPI0025BE39C6|nr:bile acid:sodium symporter [Kordia sp.]MCH2193518.1 bile acid:sodium symporter [Kordia sp.]